MKKGEEQHSIGTTLLVRAIVALSVSVKSVFHDHWEDGFLVRSFVQGFSFYTQINSLINSAGDNGCRCEHNDNLIAKRCSPLHPPPPPPSRLRLRKEAATVIKMSSNNCSSRTVLAQYASSMDWC